MSEQESWTEGERHRADVLLGLLRDRGATAPCSRCGTAGVVVDPRVLVLPMQSGVGRFTGEAGQDVINMAVVGCNHCGHLMFHSLDILGLSALKPFQ